MTIIEKFIALVCEIISDKRFYYSQNRETFFATDCSDLILRCLKNAGLPIGKATYTGNMLDQLKATGYYDVFKFDKTKLQRGDILLKHISGNNGHVVLYLGDNKIGEAAGKKAGLRITNYYYNSYQYIIRIRDEAKCKMTTIRKGDITIEVGLLQLFLNKYAGERLVIDCDFGSKTQEAVKNFQIRYNLEVDGIVGKETWSKIYFIMVAAS